MRTSEIHVEFGGEASPAPLKAAFGELLGAVEPFAAARDSDAETLTEVVWSALHGLAALTEGSRLRPHEHRARVDLLVEMVAAGT